MARQPVLRTAIEWHDRETPRQLVHATDGVTLCITEYDCSALAPGEHDERLAGYLRSDRTRDFDFDLA